MQYNSKNTRKKNIDKLSHKTGVGNLLLVTGQLLNAQLHNFLASRNFHLHCNSHSLPYVTLHCNNLNHTNHKNSKMYVITLQQNNINATLDAVCLVKVFQHLATSQMKHKAEHLLNACRKCVILACSV